MCNNKKLDSRALVSFFSTIKQNAAPGATNTGDGYPYYIITNHDDTEEGYSVTISHSSPKNKEENYDEKVQFQEVLSAPGWSL